MPRTLSELFDIFHLNITYLLIMYQNKVSLKKQYTEENTNKKYNDRYYYQMSLMASNQTKNTIT